ncbi:MAG: hypothetical protein SGILL_000500 [Bacillariaceae sp.]
MGISVSQLYAIDRINVDDLMERGTFMSIIRKIEAMSADTSGETLWMRLEDAFNSIMQDIVLSKRQDQELLVALDDDKLHFHYSKSTNTRNTAEGLKLILKNFSGSIVISSDITKTEENSVNLLESSLEQEEDAAKADDNKDDDNKAVSDSDPDDDDDSDATELPPLPTTNIVVFDDSDYEDDYALSQQVTYM